MKPVNHDGGQRLVARDDLDQLLGAITRRGFRLIGPAVRDGAIVYDDISSAADLPAGWTDEQDGGRYRLRRREDAALFGYTVGPQSWKKYLFPATSVIWRQDRSGAGAGPGTAAEPAEPEPPLAFIGVRPCDLHAIAIQDRVFLGGEHIDPVYAALREGAFLVAVNCGQAGGTCFCVSMDAGPRAESGFDLALTELMDGGRHRFLVEVGTRRGADVLGEVPSQPVGRADTEAAAHVTEQTAASMGRRLDTGGLKDLLYDNFDHPRWDTVAQRCLTCANCTMVCPTCFCFSVDEVTGLAGAPAGQQRSWDSCFTLDHSLLHGGPVRASSRSRYRQWMTHKLATWIDQFGTPGCVGCGRCITWCPAGIDITEEAAAIRAGAGDSAGAPGGHSGEGATRGGSRGNA